MTTQTADLLTQALAAIPGRAERLEALASARARLAAIPAQDVEARHSQRIREMAEAAVAGGEIPENLGAKLVAAREQDLAALAERAVLATLVQLLKDEAEEDTRTGVDHALAFLADELAPLLDEVRGLDAVLAGVSSADAALRAGPQQSSAWRRLLELAARYRGLRGAQQTLVARALGDPYRAGLYCNLPDGEGQVRVIEGVGVLRNLYDLDPLRALREMDRRQAPPSWPTGDDLALLRWTAGPQAQPWLPGLAELQRAASDLTRRQAQAITDRHRIEDGASPEAVARAAAARKADREITRWR